MPTKIKVLTIDDEWTHIQLLKAILLQAGFEPITEGDSRNAVQRAREAQPDAILLDVNMPAPSGYEVFDQLRSDEATRNIPIIMVTARAQKSDLERGAALGVDDYLTKPFEPEELTACIRRAIAKRAAA